MSNMLIAKFLYQIEYKNHNTESSEQNWPLKEWKKVHKFPQH